MPCVYIAGNHEFYKGSIREGLEEGRKAAQEIPTVHFLENEAVTIGDVLFIGATLWTDYRIEGHQLPSMRHARERMNDYSLNAAYASDLTGIIKAGRPALWLHGHTHDSCDFSVGETRIICSTRGYEAENRRFDLGMVVEISGPALGES